MKDRVDVTPVITTSPRRIPGVSGRLHLQNAPGLIGHDRANPTGPPAPVRPPIDPVTQLLQLYARLPTHSRFHFQQPRITGMWRERAGKAVGSKTWRFDRMLGVHTEDENIEEDLKHGLWLHIPAGSTERHEKATVPQRQGGAWRQTRSFAGSETSRVTRIQTRLRATRRDRQSGFRNDRCVVGHIAWSGRKSVAVSINDADVARVPVRPLGISSFAG